MKWNGMEWNGMEWNGMEWNGMEWIIVIIGEHSLTHGDECFLTYNINAY